MRLLTAAAAGAVAYIAAGALIPFNWSHSLSETCHWVPMRSLSALGLSRGDPSEDDNMARAACLYRRGGYGVEIRTIINRWPDRAQLTALRAK